MINEIKFLSPETAYNYVVKPFAEGAAWMDRAWKGKNDLSLNAPALTLKERATCFIKGTFLLTPVVNFIIWLAWQTFGKPDELTDPYYPERRLSHAAPQNMAVLQTLPRTLPPPAARASVTPPGEAHPIENFAYMETGPEGAVQTNWTIQSFPDRYIVQQTCPEYSSTSFYDRNWQITEFHHKKVNGDTFDVWLRSPLRRLEFKTVLKNKEKTGDFTLPENGVWIQQPTLGFKNFITSPAQTFRFYGVTPQNRLKDFYRWAQDPPFALPFLATKLGEEEVPGQGRLLKVEIVSEWGWPYNMLKGHLWFDPQTGVLRKFFNPFDEKTGVYLPAHPLPVIERR